MFLSSQYERIVQWRGDLETLVEDGLLALEANVLGLIDEASQVDLDVLAYKIRRCHLNFTYQYRSLLTLVPTQQQRGLL